MKNISSTSIGIATATALFGATFAFVIFQFGESDLLTAALVLSLFFAAMNFAAYIQGHIDGCRHAGLLRGQIDHAHRQNAKLRQQIIQGAGDDQ